MSVVMHKAGAGAVPPPRGATLQYRARAGCMIMAMSVVAAALVTGMPAWMLDTVTALYSRACRHGKVMVVKMAQKQRAVQTAVWARSTVCA